jgi:hypothetical protein
MPQISQIKPVVAKFYFMNDLLFILSDILKNCGQNKEKPGAKTG